MGRFILGVVAVFLAVGPIGAVELKEGDLVFVSSGNSFGLASPSELSPPFSLSAYDVSSGDNIPISGCVGFDPVAETCDEWLGDGFSDFGVVRWIRYISREGVVIVETYDFVDVASDSPFPLPSVERENTTFVAVDSRTGNRSVLGNVGDFDGFVGPYPAPAQVDPDPIQVGIPLPEWFAILVVGFLLGVFYMKGKYDGRVVA